MGNESRRIAMRLYPGNPDHKRILDFIETLPKDTAGRPVVGPWLQDAMAKSIDGLDEKPKAFAKARPKVEKRMQAVGDVSEQVRAAAQRMEF